MRTCLLFTPLLFAAALLACSASDGVTGLDLERRPAAASGTLAPPGDVNQVARGLALAMHDPSVRAHVRTAMRESRWTDHKLDLHAYVATRPGQAMVAEAATRLGVPRAAFDTAIAQLPAMDLYLPFREHRIAWRGAPGVMVAASFIPDAPTLHAFRPDGSAATLQLSDGSPDEVLLILHPAEPRGVRATLTSGRTRETVEDPDDPGIALLPCLQEPYAVGTMSDCEGPPDSGGGGGGTTITPGVYLTTFYSFRGDGWWGSVEMEFRSYGYSGIPQYQNGFWFIPYTCPKGTAGRSFEKTKQYSNLQILLSPAVTNVSSVPCTTLSGYSFLGSYYVRAVEIDGGLNLNDDDFGIRFFHGGTIPFGAQVRYDELYFSKGGYPFDPYRLDNTGAGQLSVAMTLQYR